ncbi:major facilitator superfamily transporter [Colletotrichum musicola]|uniref:Major facilitator superfamily transporter n=1 Tax=Colletotrichum musicola TaxID=2175873 RepID=A0A8H6U4I6_9PEZI|nr:major facilitator superfamily transporter [Colletotrichum musicola]
MEAAKETKPPIATPADSPPTEQAELASSPQPPAENEKSEADENALERNSSAAPSEEPEYPGSAQVAVIMACILGAIFLMSLDRTIIATAIPRMTDEFHSIQDIGWYGSAFMVTTCCFQLLWGKVYTFYPAKYVFLALLGLFEVGSAICGAAPSSLVFIIGRAVAGMGSAGILSGAIVLMMGAVPLAKRPLYNGFFSAVLGTPSVVGPLLGGAFTSRVSWRWCFFINLPIGGAAMVVIFFALKPAPAAVPGLTARQQLAKLDLLGELFLFPSLICLLLALQWGGITYDWNSWRIILLLVLFAVCLVAFVVVEVLRQENATIHLEVIKNRTVVSAMRYVFCLASTMFLLIYYLPIWFQAIQGKSAVDSGVATLPLVISLVVASTLSGQLVGRLGYYTPFTMLSSVLMPVGAGGSFRRSKSTRAAGAGSDSRSSSASASAWPPARPDRRTDGSPEEARPGGGLARLLLPAARGRHIRVRRPERAQRQALIEGLTDAVKDLDPQTIVSTGATALRDVLPAADLPTVLVKYNEAIRWVFVVGAVTASLSALGSFTLEWKSVKGDEKPKLPAKDE